MGINDTSIKQVLIAYIMLLIRQYYLANEIQLYWGGMRVLKSNYSIALAENDTTYTSKMRCLSSLGSFRLPESSSRWSRNSSQGCRGLFVITAMPCAARFSSLPSPCPEVWRTQALGTAPPLLDRHYQRPHCAHVYFC